MKYANDMDARPSPQIYRSWFRAGIEWGQAVAGLALFAGAVVAWRALRGRLPAPGPAAWWAGQVGVVAGLLVVLLGVERFASRRWGWYQLRLGMVLGACAVVGFVGVRLAVVISGVAQ